MKENGEMDWKTLGNILTANLLGEVMCSLNLADMVDLSYPSTRATINPEQVLCASYVDFKYGRMSRDCRVDTEWR